MLWKWYFLNYIQQTTIKSPLRGSFTLLVWLKYVVPDTFGATFPFFVRPCCTVTEVRSDNKELKWKGNLYICGIYHEKENFCLCGESLVAKSFEEIVFWKLLQLTAKGQMKSECIYEIVNFPKHHRKISDRYLPRNSD